MSEYVELEGLQDKVFSDRYALKDPGRNIKVGDKVVVASFDENNREQRDIGDVVEVGDRTAKVKLRTSGEVVEATHSNIDVVLEKTPANMWDRMAYWLSQKTESEDVRDYWEKEFRNALYDFKFSPGGRINALVGSEELRNLTDVPDDFDKLNLTAYNCYYFDVLPDGPIEAYGRDSREAIMDTAKRLVNTMAAGGGVGINVSPLRPNLAYIKGVNGKSSGAVGWMNLYSFLTGNVSQGGSRRGALMLILNDWHPDIIEFIFCKNKEEDIPHIRDKWGHKFPHATFVARGVNNANISVGISDRFMDAVKKNGDWDLMFPDYESVDSDVYNKEWDGNIWNWIDKGYPVKKYATVKARDLWECIIESAWASAEPGVVFLERANKESNSWYFNPLNGTNPCGEQPLPDHGVCLLGHINLSRFAHGPIGKAEVDWDGIARTVRAAVRFLDDVIDYTPYHLKKNEENQKSERRIGMGTLGLGEMLIRLGKRYGRDSQWFVDELYRFIALEAYKASIDIAEEKGAFHKFEYDKFIQSGFMQRLLPELPSEYQKKLKKTGIRNVTLLTAAPTGSTGTMIGTSTGIEPYYSWTYWRTGRLGTSEVNEKIVEEYLKENGLPLDTPHDKLPKYFVTAMELEPIDHVAIQAAVQRWTCSAVSKTVNAPHDYTVEQTRELYELAYDMGLKGITLYRDGSRSEQVLSLKENEDKDVVSDESNGTSMIAGTMSYDSQQRVIKRPSRLFGTTEKIKLPNGTKLYVTPNATEDGDVIEVFVNGGEGDDDMSAMCTYVGRLISTALKYGVPLEDIVKQGNKVPGGEGFFYKADFEDKGRRLKNIPSAISMVLSRYLSDEENERATATRTKNPCPVCGGELTPGNGCFDCKSCGYSKCG